jgi:hypothetical protein
LENTGEVRVGDDLFDNGVMAGWIGIRTAVSQTVITQLFYSGLKIALLVVEEALAVGDEILKVPKLWPVHRRIIHFGDDAIPKCKPDPAGSRISRSEPIFASVSPFGLDARPSKCLRLVRGAHEFIVLFDANKP